MNIHYEMKRTLCMLMAGGKGERLYPLTKDWAKPSVRFGGGYRIIDFTLSNCLNSDVRKIYVLTQYRSVPLERHIRLGWNIFSYELDEFIECVPPQQRNVDRWYRGTADSIYQNVHILQRERPERVLILSGDHIYKMNYNDMLAYHLEKNAQLTVAGVEVDRLEASAFGVIGCDDDYRITSWEEKPSDPKCVPGKPDKSFVSMGVYIFDTEVLVQEVIGDAKADESSHDFGKDIVPSMIRKNRVFVHKFEEPHKNGSSYWRDVGTLDAYWESNLDLVSPFPQCNLYDDRWPIRTLQEQSQPSKIIGDTTESAQRGGGQITDSLIAGGCLLGAGHVSQSVISYKVSAGPRSVIRESVLLDGVSVGRSAQVRKAIVCRNVRVPEGFRIGFDLDEDSKRFAVSPAGVVVVPEGAILD
jgi:glucose-1-phosphate adenylyltransferase